EFGLAGNGASRDAGLQEFGAHAVTCCATAGAGVNGPWSSLAARFRASRWMRISARMIRAMASSVSDSTNSMGSCWPLSWMVYMFLPPVSMLFLRWNYIPFHAYVN